MVNLRKTALAVLAFGSSAVFAGTMGPVCTPGNVTVPCESTAWDIGVQALYLKTSYSGPLAWLGFTTPVAAAGPYYYTDLDPDWAWGFKLEGSYHFSTGNDLNLNWYHVNKSSDLNVVGYSPFLIDVGVVDAAYFSYEPRWDAVNLEFGQHVDFGEFKDIRFHAGVQYARIKSELAYNASVTDGGVVTSYYAPRNHSFNGFGPRAGLDMSYDWGNGFAMYGNGAAALLVGTTKFSDYITTSAAGTTFYESGSRTHLVPELELKLGLMYSWPMAQGDLTLDGGWMWVNYFDAHAVSHPLTVASVTPVAPSDSNFALSGPYFGLKWIGTVI